MKRFFTLFFSLLFSLTFAFAQAPPLFNYQAVVRDAAGVVLSNQEVVLKVSVIKGELTGEVVFTETHTITTSVEGVISVAIGSVNSDVFQAIDWENSPYFLSVEVNGTMLGTTQILSVPYAFYANSAGNSFSGDFNDLQNVPENLDTDSSDDFDGKFSSLTDLPENIDLDKTDDFSGDYNDLANIPELRFFWGDKDRDGYGDKYKAVYSTVAPDGYVQNADDCNDDNETTHPEAEEICDGIDNDCDGEIDNNPIDLKTWYLDSDNDGYGVEEVTTQACFQPEGYSENSLDCNDEDDSINPSAQEVCDDIDNNCNGELDEDAADATVWFQDADADGYGDDENSLVSCTQPEGYVIEPGDCNDSDTEIHPEADEYCDAIDNNCNGDIDEDAVDATDWYLDMDEDGFGNNIMSFPSCTYPEDMPYLVVSNNFDCDDGDPNVNPAANEIADGKDNDCDGLVDEDITTISCETPDDCPPGFYCFEGECVSDCPPGFIDCGGSCIDPSTDSNNCGSCGEVCPPGYDCQDGECYLNCDDGLVKCGNECVDLSNDSNHCGSCGSPCPDGYGCQNGQCSPLEDLDADGYLSDVDCDDSDPEINPGAAEIPDDGVDNDCDGQTDEEFISCDMDADCPSGYICQMGECVPESVDVEICNDGLDNDADGYTDCDDPDCFGDDVCEGFVDEDGDGYTSDVDCDDSDPEINPSAVEIPDDGVDNDCDGQTDEEFISCNSDADCPSGYICQMGECVLEGSVETNCNDFIDNDADGYTDCEDPDCYGNGNCQPLEDEDDDGYTSDVDCDDSDPEINPGAAEIPDDGVDNNCNGQVDENGETTCTTDSDCPAGQHCVEGQCEEFCFPNCAGMECGDDGCGGSCGSCPPEHNCFEGMCHPDSDGDGVVDINDVCPGHDDNIDTDEDGIPDGCDDDMDDDDDGIANSEDNCPFVFNPDQTDSDANGIGDACEDSCEGQPCDDGNACTEGDVFDADCNCIGGPMVDCDDGNPCTMDTCDPVSGCIHISNVMPCDDGNPCTTNDTCIGGECTGTPVNCGDGSTCDPATGACIPLVDSDSDGIFDDEDNCPQVPNPVQEDTDEDGVGDFCDNCIDTVNPEQEDSNGNGIGDACEPIAGNTCALPISIDPASLPFADLGNTSTLTNEYSTNCTGYSSNGSEVVYVFTPQTSATYTVRIEGGATNFDAVIYIRTICDDDDSCVGSSDSQPSGGDEEVNFASIPGETYFIFVDGFGSDDMGDYFLTVEEQL